jgi:hypothetical protein
MWIGDGLLLELKEAMLAVRLNAPQLPRLRSLIRFWRLTVVQIQYTRPLFLKVCCASSGSSETLVAFYSQHFCIEIPISTLHCRLKPTLMTGKHVNADLKMKQMSLLRPDTAEIRQASLQGW